MKSNEVFYLAGESCKCKGVEARKDQSQLTENVGRVGTPTFFIGNREKGFIKISGAQPLSRFDQAISNIQS